MLEMTSEPVCDVSVSVGKLPFSRTPTLTIDGYPARNGKRMRRAFSVGWPCRAELDQMLAALQAGGANVSRRRRSFQLLGRSAGS